MKGHDAFPKEVKLITRDVFNENSPALFLMKPFQILFNSVISLLPWISGREATTILIKKKEGLMRQYLILYFWLVLNFLFNSSFQLCEIKEQVWCSGYECRFVNGMSLVQKPLVNSEHLMSQYCSQNQPVTLFEHIDLLY